MNPTHPAQSYSVDELVKVLGTELVKVVGDINRRVSYPAAILEAESNEAITFCSASGEKGLALLTQTRAGVIVCNSTIELNRIGETTRQTFMVVNSPRLTFLRLVQTLFSEPLPRGIHATAVIDPRAKIHPDTFIGPYTSIGCCEISQGTVIYGHVHIYDNVQIGKNVIIYAGSVIGGDGFGYERNESGKLEKFPHVGGVLIENDVEIGSNTCIDRGTLGNTIIREGAKIDNLVHIAHNVVVGRHSVIIAHAMIGGGTKIGDFAWVAPSSSVRDGLVIGERTIVGLGAVVVKDIPPNLTVMGVPARSAEAYKKLLKHWDALIE